MPVDDPFDPQTPMLSYAEVGILVSALTDDQLRRLSAGPISEDKQCRLCQVLKPIAAGDGDPAERAAVALVSWHDDLGRSSWFVDHVEPKMFPGEIERAKAEEKHLFGAIQYARCCTVYALATVELGRREVRKGKSSIVDVLNEMVRETQEEGRGPVEQAAAAGVEIGELAVALEAGRVAEVFGQVEEMGSMAILGGLGEAFVAGVRWERGG